VGYLFAIPANEIVIPTVLMLPVLVAGVMLFILTHSPCSTKLTTIFHKTGYRRWTALAPLIPLAMGLAVTFFVAQAWRLFAGAG
jgi:ferrous iron transport protein B